MDKPWKRMELAQIRSSLHFSGKGEGVSGAQKFIRAEYFRNFWVLLAVYSINSTFAGFLICLRLLPLCTDFGTTSTGVTSHAKIYLEMFMGTL
jgi:hypothetical protein